MSDWHYCRTTGADGGVDAVEGRAYGIDLESVFKDGLPPFKVALEIIAALCETLDIAEEDDEGHGDMVPADVYIDETGAISIEGFGEERDQTMAPEGRPGYASDLWGLGYVSFRLFSPEDLGELPDDPDEYDDTIIDAVLAINFDALPEEIVGDIQWFLAKLMSWEPDDRPPAIDVWRTFIAFADSVDGPSVIDWGPEAMDGAGARRDEDGLLRDPSELGPPAEDLGGPIAAQGPLSRGGGIDFSSGGGKQGQATAFWSRDAMKAALQNEPDEEEISRDPHLAEQQPYRPQVGGGSSTSFWSLDQMKAMAEGGDAAPRPKRRGKAGERSSARQTPAAAAPAPPAAPAAPAPPPVIGGPVAGGPVAGGPVAGGPVAGGPVAAPAYVPPPAAPADSGGGKGGLIAGGAVMLMAALCLGGSAIGGGIWFMNQDTTEPVKGPAPAPVPTTPKDTGGADPEPEPAPEPAPAPKPKPRPKPKPKPSTTGTSAPRPAPRPAPAPKPKPAPAPTTGIAQVTVRTPGLAFISCGDGQKAEISGSLAMEFDGLQLPVACRIIDDASGAMWAGSIGGSGTVACTVAGKDMTCKAP